MPSSNDRFKLYAVSKGRRPGIYNNWALAEQQVVNYSGAVFKGFGTERAAEKFMHSADIPHPRYIVAEPVQDLLTNKSKNESSSVSLSNSLNDTELFANATTTNACSTPARHNSICTNCSQMTEVIDRLMDRLVKLENVVSSKVASLEDGNVTILKRLESLDTLISQNNTKEILELTESTKLQFESLNNTLKRYVNNPELTYATAAKPNRPHAPANTFQARPSPTQLATPSSVQDSRKQRVVKFDPMKCMVITGISSEQYPHLNQDRIRRAITGEFGPIIIDIVNRYKSQSSNPKFIVQLGSAQDVDKLVDGWKSELFGGSAARKTITPILNPPIGMVKGVPLDIDDDELAKDIKTAHPNSSIYRLRASNGNQLRTVKVQFKSEECLNKAIAKGLTLQTSNLLLRVELPTSPANENMTNINNDE